jgi:hypothetical protein
MRVYLPKTQKNMLEQWKQVEEKHLTEIADYLKSSKSLSIEFSREKTIQPLGFNVFTIVSDTYRRENFHSYLICNLLSPLYNNEGQFFIIELINCLNELTNPKNKIQHNDFTAPVVEREKDRIDIRIRDSISRKSIIIENKINNAIDQDNQIPRYYKSETDSNYEVIGIVYLTLTEGKKPNEKSWKVDSEVKSKIVDALIYLTASKNDEKTNLLTWIDKCANISNQIDVISTLRQYKSIIQHLREKEMNHILMEKFYNQLKLKDDNYATALSIRDMLGDMQEFRASRLKNYFNSDEKKAKLLFKDITSFVWSKEHRAKFENSQFKNIKFWIDVVCVEKETRVYFHEEDSTSNDKIKILLEKIEEFKDFKESTKQAYFRVFQFPNEDNELFRFLENVFVKLEELKEIDF